MTMVPSSCDSLRHGVFLVFLEDGIELEGVGLPLPGQTDNQPAGLRALNLPGLQQVPEQNAVVVLS